MDKDQECLARVTVNYLFLAQFETFRASLISLKKRNPALALSILQAIVEKGGRNDGVVWSSSATSPSHLAWLAVGELLGFGSISGADPIWKLHPHRLKLKVEFLLLVDSIRSRFSSDPQTLGELPQTLLQLPELESSPSNDRKDQADEPASNGDDSFERAAVALCDTISSHGLQRLQADIHNQECGVSSESFTEAEQRCLRRMACDLPLLLDALCENVERQKRLGSGYDGKLAISVYEPGSSSADGDIVQKPGDSGGDFKLGLRVQQEVQWGHLDALKASLENGDLEASFRHLRFLHQDYGPPESAYRPIIHDLTRKTKSQGVIRENAWFQACETMLRIYEEVLASSSMQLTKMVEATQDDLIREEAEKNRASNEDLFPPPLHRLQQSFQDLHSGHFSSSRNISVTEGLAINSCMRELYHYARVSGEHVMDIVMNAALSAVKGERLQEASNVLALFPRLQPLVAAMGWDLLTGKTAARRKLMDLLWTSKSKILLIEDLSIYGKQGEEVCCVEHLCDHLCYRLELAYFAACINSGQDWDPKTCLLFSGRKGKQNSENTDGGPVDPFVANFVLERLAVQTPLRVLFDVVPDIKFQDALELVNMQPVPSAAAAWHRCE